MSFGEKPCGPALNPLPPNFRFGLPGIFPAHAKEKGDDMGWEVGVEAPKPQRETRKVDRKVISQENTG
jgi:hypothetical protein